MKEEIIFKNPHLCFSLLKNGYIRTTGINIVDRGLDIVISAVNSKGKSAKGFIQIDKSAIDDLIKILTEIKIQNEGI